MTWFNLARIGLIYDIAGVIALAWGFLIIGPRDFAQVNLAWRADPDTEKLAFAKVDAIFGVGLIALGFVGQLLGSDNVISDGFLCLGTIAPICALLAIALAMTLFVLFRGRFAQAVVGRAGAKNGNL